MTENPIEPGPPACLRPGLDRLKDLWNQMDEAARDDWLDIFASDQAPEAIRARIQAALNVDLPSDERLARFRAWVRQQDQRAENERRMRDNEERLRQLHPDWDLDRIREEILRQAYFESLSSGDFKLGLSAMQQDDRGRKVAQDFRRLSLLEQKAAAQTAARTALHTRLTPKRKDAEYGRIFGAA